VTAGRRVFFPDCAAGNILEEEPGNPARFQNKQSPILQLPGAGRHKPQSTLRMGNKPARDASGAGFM